MNQSIVSFTVQCNDSILHSIEVTISSKPNIITFNQLQDTSQSPGQVLDLPFSGTISTGTSMPFQFRMSLSLNFQILDLINNKDTLELSDSIHTYRIPVSIIQERTRVIVSSDSIFMLNEGITSWKVKVPFNVMLSQFDVCEIQAELSDTMHSCYSQAKGNRIVHINEVCANEFSKVAEAGVQFNLIRISPNPVGESGTAEFTLQGDGIVTLDAVNPLGERIKIAEEYLTSGHYELQFSTKNFANGVYGIIVRAADGRERRAMFVIER
ncbi:MAG: hypothetical protein IPM69_07860 [Ignavibacteria bacterium]|nr:hypothetical protein [Ignavibacteria bacterium]